MTKYGDGLGYEIVKAVLNGDIIEPITYQKVNKFCDKKGILASKNHMRVILSNASENTHSPSYKKYFERTGKGEYVILPEYRRETGYYWLNVDSKGYEWSFSDFKIGTSQTYSNYNPNGNQRNHKNCFRNIQIDDMVVAYETGELKSITALCKVVNKYEKNDEIFIEFQKIKDYNTYLHIDSMEESEELKDCKTVHFHRGTLFQLEEVHFNIILNMLEKLNIKVDNNEELYRAVQKSLKDTSDERKKRIENRKSVIPESYESTTKSFKRNADVIAEVLLKANGVCNNCKQKAPFLRASDRTPYLEVHHVIRLAAGGEDTVDNAVALCPNCHRKEHFG